MKKTTFLLVALATTLCANAQFSYTTLKTDGFEASYGMPSTFSRTGQSAWSTATPAYTGGFWDLVFASTTPKDYVVSANTTEYHSGTQCIQIDTKTATAGLRLRSATGTAFANNINDWGNYKVSIYAKATAGTQIFNSITTTATGGWDKYEFTSSYSTGVSETRLMLDLKPTGGTSTIIYFDDLLIEQYAGATPVVNAATNIGETGFTASWSAIAGATSYRLTIQSSSDGGTTWTTTKTVNNATGTSNDVTGLTAGTLYRYKVEGFDGTYYSPSSAYSPSLTTSTVTGLNEVKVKSVYAANGILFVDLSEAQNIDIFSSNGQHILSVKGTIGLNSVILNKAGIYVLKSGAEVQKVILN